MGKNLLSVFVLLLLLLIIASGCGKAASNQSSENSSDADKPLISITSGGETALSYQRFSWGDSYENGRWLAADAVQLVCELPDIAPKLPVITYHDDFTVQFQEGVNYTNMTVYDERFEYLYNIATYSDMDYLTCLAQLPEGTYYVGISVCKKGDYIASQKKYEYSGTDCVFKLVVQ